jgi:hypothetical protein
MTKKYASEEGAALINQEEVVSDNSDIQKLTSANVVAVVLAIGFVVFCAVVLASTILDGSPLRTLIVVGGGAVVSVVVLMETLGKRLVLGDGYLESRDWLFRERRVPYEQVESIHYNRSVQLTISLSGGRTISWPAKTRGIESFIGALSERVTRVRPVQISGDLEIE